MPVTELRVEGYRSIKEIRLPLRRVNIILGPNGCGKSNLYRSIGVLRAAAEGALSRALATEGGMPSVLWAGERSQGPARVKVGVTLDEFDYDLELGSPLSMPDSAFGLDPEIKNEALSMAKGKKRIAVLKRGIGTCYVRNGEGEMESYTMLLNSEESTMDQIADPRRFPLLDDLRRKLLKWRFYHGFRTDAGSPMRQRQIGVRTRVLAADGSDVAAALRTIQENGDQAGLDEAIADAFPGSTLRIDFDNGGMQVAMQTAGIARPMLAGELSDGTLRYLCLLAALLSPSPAPLLALNEPETSLHENLLEPLARLIANASLTSQIWLTTHSHILADKLAELTVVKPILLDKIDGATQRAGRNPRAAFDAEYDL